MPNGRRSLFIAGLLATIAQAGGEPTVSLASLLDEMLDRGAIAKAPDPRYRCVQFSSADPSSIAPGVAGWFANDDRTNFLRVEQRSFGDGSSRQEYVCVDTDGSGAIVRGWATWNAHSFSNDTLRIYTTEEQWRTGDAAIEGRVADIISGGQLAGAPLSESVSPLSPEAERGHNLYLPIPFADRCVVTYESDAPLEPGAPNGSEAFYYVFNVRVYEDGTAVTPLTAATLDDNRERIASVNETLANRWLLHVAAADATIDLPGGAIASVMNQRSNEPSAVTRLSTRLEAKDLGQALRSTIVEITFDGSASSFVPIGDLFGVGTRAANSATWYQQSRIDEKGIDLACSWVMPFQRRATMRVHNRGEHGIRLSPFIANVQPMPWTARSMRFHAVWTPRFGIETGPGESGASDQPFLRVRGAGVYAGDVLTVYNRARAWWGEGDEKIFVDGEMFPSHFGTGSEDYYGYAWCRSEPFDAPFHAQVDGSGNMLGGWAVNARYRALDAIPFERSLNFDMELWHWAKTSVDFCSTAFVYLREGAELVDATSEAEILQAASRRIPQGRDGVEAARRVAGAIEGEYFDVVRVGGGEAYPQVASQYGWSGDAQMWWLYPSPGDTLDLSFKIPNRMLEPFVVNRDGVAHPPVEIALTKAQDYATVRILINGVEIKPENGSDAGFDRYHPTVAWDRIEVGNVPLRPGVNTMTIECLGMNPEAAPPKFMFGLDYLRIIDR